MSDQSWTANVGLLNYEKLLTDSRIRADFVRIFLWTLVFATLSVVTTFLLGLALAATLNDPRLRGQKIYRAVLIVPYAIPGFISLLVWASFFNTDFGLINDLTGLSINWFGNTTTARIAVVLTNLWMGFPYMFLVCTGALQAIAPELKEAAAIDGASGWKGFSRGHVPAAARDRGAAAGGDVRLQLQQLQRDPRCSPRVARSRRTTRPRGAPTS